VAKKKKKTNFYRAGEGNSACMGWGGRESCYFVILLHYQLSIHFCCEWQIDLEAG
jgi:hypothetical protein